MRFLCLHGVGTNSQVLETQTAALRYELGDDHSYDYVEGNIPVAISPEISSYFSTDEEYFAYFDPEQPDTFGAALDQLEAFISSEGPYDAVLAYSHGAQLVASLLCRLQQRNPKFKPFKCAVFLSGAVPYQFNDDRTAVLEFLQPDEASSAIKLPAANIWGANDLLHPNTSCVLNKLCDPKWSTEFIHTGGHDIPSSKDQSNLQGSVKAIRRTIDLAKSLGSVY